MRMIVAMLLVGACVNAASAQSAHLDGRFEAVWAQEPNQYDLAGNYPRQARAAGLPGFVHLCCTPLDSRRLDCRVAFEYPQDRHFGEAALRVARRYRISRDSYAAFQSQPGAWLQVDVLWEPIVAARNHEEVALGVEAQTQRLCAPR